MAKFFPIFINLEGKPCLVVGGGEIATRKAEQLLNYGACLTIVAPEASADVLRWADEGRVKYLRRKFDPVDVEGQSLVVGSTDSEEVNREVFKAADGRGIPVNIVDVPELCSFIYGALVQRGDFQIAISTSGKSPAFAGYLRRQLEEQFGEEYAQYLEILGEARAEARKNIADLERQKAIYQQIMELDLLEMIRNGRSDEARRKALDCISP